MKVSVIVPAFNEEVYISECLIGLLDQEERADEIIVVDNNSTDKTVEIAKKFPVRIVKEKRQGMIYARNRGFNVAKRDIIARTDSDVRVSRNWIKQIKEAFRDDDLLGYSGPAAFYAIPSILQPYNWLSMIWFAPFKLAFRHDFLVGPNMAIRKSAWKLVRDEVCVRDRIVHEDMDLSYHLGRIGKIKFDPTHVISMSPRKFKKFYPYLEYGYRNLRTIQHHKYDLHRLKQRPRLVARVIPKTRKFLKYFSSNNASI